MNRAELRRAEREANKKKATYNLTQEQLDTMVHDAIKDKLAEVKEIATNEAINTAMILLLTLPLEVLMDNYWQKTYRQRIPKFTEQVLEYYAKWQNDELDIEKLKEDLWEYGGVKLEEVD